MYKIYNLMDQNEIKKTKKNFIETIAYYSQIYDGFLIFS